MRPHAELPIAILAAALAAPAASQSIADYSHVQRALLEASMVQAAARMAALGASSPGPAASGPTVSPPASEPGRAAAAPEASIGVDGVFDGGERRLVELRVDGRPFMLCPGQAVPNTDWHVAEIAVDRVVLVRSIAGGTTTRARPATKIFALPALASTRTATP